MDDKKSRKLIGENYTTPDLVAKVTGRAKYAEDYRADGMLFCKLLLSPMPHARVTRIDTSAALALPGVKGILTADDLPAPAATITDAGQVIQASLFNERALTNEPLYRGEPILAVAAVDELTAAEAIERIRIDFRGAAPPPPRPEIKELKWTEADFADYAAGRLPMGKPATEWSYGDLDAGFKNAALVLDETFVTPSTGNQPLESRTAMAYWQNGKLYMHCSTQSTAQTVPAIARWVGIEPTQVVLISEYCGGAFGSKVSGSITMAVPALLSKKVGAPVMMRISRDEEHHIGRFRPALHGRIKIGFASDGRITAVDMYSIVDNGPYEQQGDLIMSGRMVSLMYQPLAMRWRGVSVVTNTMPTGSQSQPGGAQGVMIMEPILAKASRRLKIDQVAIHRVNAPEGKAKFGPANPRGQRAYVTGAFAKDALDRGAALFRWDERVARSGKRAGSIVRGIGVAASTYISGSIGFDGLFVIMPDGRLSVQSGVGNLAKKKLQQIAATDLGGKPDDYEVANERVFRKGGGAGMTLAHAATRAIALGGVYDGHELPKDINGFTKASAAALAGQGLMGVARDSLPRDGATHSFVAGFAEVEVDVETGKYHILDYLAVADVGTVVHPHSLGGQILGRSMLGIGHAIGQKTVYDKHYGMPLATRFYQNRPPTILDAPQHMAWDAVNIPDPETPIGAKGIGEPPVSR